MNLKQICDEAQAKGLDSAIFKIGRGKRRRIGERVAIVPGLLAWVLSEDEHTLIVELKLADAEKYARNLQKRMDKSK